MDLQEIGMAILDKIFSVIFRWSKDDEQKPPCPNLYWTLPDIIRVGKKEKMKPVCEVGLKTGPTCGGFYRGKPHCGSYQSD